MAVRKLNFTDRRKISPDDVVIRLFTEPDGSGRFEASIQNLRDVVDQGDARVSVEAYRQTVRMSFDFGTVDAIRQPSDCRLVEFGRNPEVARFRVRVTDMTRNAGRLLAEVSQLSPLSEREGEGESLLDVKPADLGQVPFRVEFSSLTDRVMLLVNDRFPDWKAFADSSHFKAFFGPTVLREILARAIYVEKCDDPTGDEWPNQWLRFAQVVNPTAEPISSLGIGDSVPESDAIDDWIDDVVRTFCLKHQSFDRLQEESQGGTSDD